MGHEFHFGGYKRTSQSGKSIPVRGNTICREVEIALWVFSNYERHSTARGYGSVWDGLGDTPSVPIRLRKAETRLGRNMCAVLRSFEPI